MSYETGFIKPNKNESYKEYVDRLLLDGRFLRKNNRPKNIYTEGHHIVPLKYQDRFDVNLDVEANIVSLCSNCHNNLHYGKDYEKTLRLIFTEERKNRLKKCGIIISFEDLLEMYK